MMFSKYCLILLLLVSYAFAQYANTRIECVPDEGVVYLKKGLNVVSCSVALPDNWKKDRVFDVEVTFTGVPGVALASGENKTKIVSYLEKGWKPAVREWNVTVAKNGTYSLTNAFETTWDDSVYLEVSKPSESVMNWSKDNITINFVGRTDGADFCLEMQKEVQKQMLNQKELNQKELQEELLNFWSRPKNCLTRIHLEGPLVKFGGNLKPTVVYNGYADEIGRFNFSVSSILNRGANKFTLSVTDPSGNTKTKIFTVYCNAPPPSLLDDPNNRLLIAGGAVFFVILIAVIAYWYSKKRAEVEVEKTLKMKEEEGRKKHLQELKIRKVQLKKKLKELNTKKVNIGLTSDEISQMRAYENELVRIMDELLANEEYLEELKERAKKAAEEAIRGTPSSEIRKELMREGYTEEERELIKKYFSELKGS